MRSWAARCLAPIAIAVVLLAQLAPPAHALRAREPRPSLTSIVIDAETGKVLVQDGADVQNHPASLTKMMTLYLVFEALAQGRIRLDTQYLVSANASEQSPTKLGVEPGESITVHDLIFGMITRSANDAAVVAAEGLAGNEDAFVERMNAKARALGMTHTVFRNPSGLPDPEQVTTARDLVKLARALYHDFPDRYPYFSTEEFVFRGAILRNHNHLMEHFPGMDGIKTGYVRASGFNLAASAVRDGRRVIGVVLGGQSPAARDEVMASLLNQAFGQQANDPVLALNEATDNAEARSFIERGSGPILNSLAPIASAQAAEPAPKLRSGDTALSREPHGETHWGIQIGAFAERPAALRAVKSAFDKLASLKNKVVEILAPTRLDRLYRARIVNFTAKEAERACEELRERHTACSVVPTGAVHVAEAR